MHAPMRGRAREFWAMGSPGKLTHLEIKVLILHVHIMTFLFYPAARRARGK